MKILAFDIYGKFGHYKKYWTTSSPLTYSFPPATAVAGLLGAIVGINKYESNLSSFFSEECKMAIKIVNPIRKQSFGQNLINTKEDWNLKGKDPRTLINVEYLMNPRFCIYFSHTSDVLFNEVIELVGNNNSKYSICLGLSECLAQIKYKGIFEADQVKNEDYMEINTPIDVSHIVDKCIDIENDKKYLIDNSVPVLMDKSRIIKKYGDFIYEKSGKPIKTKVKQNYCLENGENIVFF